MNITEELYDFCILIPYYNNLQGLIKSLQSVKYNKNRCFIVIVDDGSFNKLTQEDLYSTVVDLMPFKILTLPNNSGITVALNSGLRWIQKHLDVPYIARLDCGDICHQERFYRQINYLNNNSDISLLGSWCIFKSSVSSQHYQYVTPTSHQRIAREMHFRNVFIHPTVVFRTSLLSLIGLYSEEYEFVEDYAFFWTALNKSKAAVIDEFLVTCEINTSGISISQRKKQLIARMRIVNTYGSNEILKQVGLLKLKILMAFPYSTLLKIKYLKCNVLGIK